MLKALPALALVALAASPAVAGEAAPLVVGSVRDQRGAPVTGADVTAFDRRGRPEGHDRTDAVGTFAMKLLDAADVLEVRCAHCRPARIALAPGGDNVVVIVTRYEALESDVPGPADVAALPNAAPAAVLGLVPFALPANGGISDRGLAGGRGLVLSDGAPLVDLATGLSGLSYFPDRYARDVAVAGPERAYRYGIDAGGGIFALDQIAPGTSFGSADAGRASSLALLPSAGAANAGAGVSSDGTTLVRRADADYDGSFAGGSLRAGYDAASALGASGTSASDASTARLSYATASRTYRTSFDAFASGAAYAASPAATYGAQYLDADFRLERPGPVTLAAGANLSRQSASLGATYPYGSSAFGRVDDVTAYVDAHAADNRTTLDAGLGLTDVAATVNAGDGPLAATHLAALPSIALRTALGGGAYVRAAYSESARVPTLLETSSLPQPLAPAFERGELAESALGFDDARRVRAEAIVYQEFTHGFDERRLDGVGVSVAWQLAPLVSVRAWSLRASPLTFSSPLVPENDASRQLFWTTYANPAGLRFDAIAHRDAATAARAAYAFDLGALAPLVPRVSLAAGTAQLAGTRHYFVGLRAER